MTSDPRMSWDLVFEVFDVLDRHGYHERDDHHGGVAVGMIFDLTRVYEGSRDAPYGAYTGQIPPSPHASRGHFIPGADRDGAILSGTDVSTVMAALDTAEGYELDRAAECADCPDQSCATCQSRLQAATAYHNKGARIFDPARAANASEPGPGSLRIPPPQADHAADREAGQ
jgi:hypothetical protein